MYRVGLVCEGPTDRVILEAILDAHLDDYESLSIQPPISRLGGDAGQHGGGWKGVRAWCQQVSPWSPGSGVHQGSWDFLVVQVDADVAVEAEVGRAKPCPPPSDGADEIHAEVRCWMGLSEVPDDLIICVPSMASETWVLVALFPNDAAVVLCVPAPADGVCIECRDDVKSLLRQLGSDMKPKLVVGQVGKLKNQRAGYEAQSAAITRAWPAVTQVCSEAARFDGDLRMALHK